MPDKIQAALKYFNGKERRMVWYGVLAIKRRGCLIKSGYSMDSLD